MTLSTVTDNGDGTLNVERTVAKDSENAAEKETTEPVGTFTNEQLHDFEFKKVWQAGGQTTTWKNDIEVTLKGAPEQGSSAKTIEAAYTIKQTKDGFEITRKSGGSELLPERGLYTGNGNDYSFKFEQLPAGYTYTLTETQLSGYNAPEYTNPDDSKADDSITSGGTITNSTGYSLPGTGGSGLMRYIGISVLLMLIAAILYINTRERRKRPS